MLFRSYDSEQKNDEAKVLYAIALIYADKLTDAEALYKGPVPLDSRVIAALEDKGKRQYVITGLLTQVKAKPDEPQLRMQLASEYYFAGDKESAIAQVQEIGRINPLYQTQVDALIKQIRAGKDPVVR